MVEGTHKYTYGRLMLMKGKNHHNIVSNYPPIKINFKKLTCLTG